jgi:hypothetical protein
MNDRVATAISKTGTIAGGYLVAWAYRCHSHGESLASKRALFVFALLLGSFAVALAWQGVSKVRYWSWTMTFIGFSLSLVVVSIAVVTVIRLTV